MADPNSPPQMASSQFSTTARPPLTSPHSSTSSSISIAHPPPSPTTLPYIPQPLSIAPPPIPSSAPPLSIAQPQPPLSLSRPLVSLPLNSFIDLNKIHLDNKPHLPLNPLIDLNQDAKQNEACIDEFLLHNRRNFARSEVPVRIMFFKNKVLDDFKGEVLESLRNSFASGKTIVP
ncbi:unnamed protein product [Lathyrus sativus]|nr:unnamed protein product [Lathyrus sativus]